jgi:diguanylate cyclase (GGDEF)-like protein
VRRADSNGVDDDDCDPDPRELAGSIVASLIRYVRRAAGDDAVARVLQLAGEERSADELLDDSAWRTVDDVVALADAATVVTGDPDVGRRAGEELFRQSVDGGFVNFILANGSPGAALVSLVAYGSKMANGRPIEPIAMTERELVLRARAAFPPNRFICGFGPGYWAQVPALFGAQGTVIEESCQCRGDDHCTFRVRWDQDAVVPANEVAESEEAADRIIASFERLQETASDLARADNVPTVLERIVGGADRALLAPKWVVALTSAGMGTDTSNDNAEDGRLSVASRGFTQEEADVVARRLLADRDDDAFGLPLVVDLASHRAHYGIVAALLPAGATVGEIDRRLLAAYAGHATAALEAVLSRELARRNHAVAQALLDLARTLAAVTSTDDVCERLALAVPDVAECEVATVWRWNAPDRALDLVSWSGTHLAPSPADRIVEEDVPPGIVATGDALLLDAEACGAFLSESERAAAGTVQCAVVPIRARGELLGVVTAAFAERHSTDDAELLGRLHGLADLAATALDNALLLDHMRHQALHDSLTGLPNRPLLKDRVQQAIRRAHRTDGGLTLMFIDLDRFKYVNDTLGHVAGDELIRLAGIRMLGCVRDVDTLARMGGDEFVLLLADTAELSEAGVVAEKLIDALHEPFAVSGHQLHISCSIGISVWPRHGLTFGELLQHADSAMYEAKAGGRNTFAVHSGLVSRRRELLDLEHRLHTAIQREELAVVYQPQIHLPTMRLLGVEALVRWDHPELGRLGPDRFVPLAEETGVITRIDAWVREQAFAQARRWIDAGVPLRVSVNVSTADLRRAELVADLRVALRDSGLPATSVELEITDRVALGEEDLQPRLQALADLGVRLAIDDFGVGSSVLGRLQHGPFHTLKIDRSLVSQIDGAARRAPIVQALAAMAHQLELEVVAEGVETASQGGLLRSYGCEMAQGYLFSPPVEAEAVAGLVETLVRGARPDT